MTRPSLPAFLPLRKLPPLAVALGLSLASGLEVSATPGLGFDPGNLVVELRVWKSAGGAGGSSSGTGAEGCRVIVGGGYLELGFDVFWVLEDGVFFLAEGA